MRSHKTAQGQLYTTKLYNVGNTPQCTYLSVDNVVVDKGIVPQDLQHLLNKCWVGEELQVCLGAREKWVRDGRGERGKGEGGKGGKTLSCTQTPPAQVRHVGL